MRVGQKGEVDFVPLGEVLEDSLTVVTDSGQLQSLRLKPFFCTLQLHELRFTEGSPVGGAEEEQNSALRTFLCVVGLLVAKLIRQSDPGSALSEFDADSRRSRTIGGRVFLARKEARNSDDEHNGKP